VEKPLQVLVVSRHAETRRTLSGVLRDLPVRTHSLFTVAQARQFVNARHVDLVFCEELLSDGSYKQVLGSVRAAQSGVRFVLVMRSGEWAEYLEALRLGVEDVLRPPLLPIDIDLVFIHSFRSSGRELVAHA
jgi:DNA-binding NtrC family response regulator